MNNNGSKMKRYHNIVQDLGGRNIRRGTHPLNCEGLVYILSSLKSKTPWGSETVTIQMDVKTSACHFPLSYTSINPLSLCSSFVAPSYRRKTNYPITCCFRFRLLFKKNETHSVFPSFFFTCSYFFFSYVLSLLMCPTLFSFTHSLSLVRPLELNLLPLQKHDLLPVSPYSSCDISYSVRYAITLFSSSL